MNVKLMLKQESWELQVFKYFINIIFLENSNFVAKFASWWLDKICNKDNFLFFLN